MVNDTMGDHSSTPTSDSTTHDDAGSSPRGATSHASLAPAPGTPQVYDLYSDLFSSPAPVPAAAKDSAIAAVPVVKVAAAPVTQSAPAIAPRSPATV